MKLLNVKKETLEQYNQPLAESILTTTYRLARNELEAKAQYQTYEEKLTPDERNIFIDVFTFFIMRNSNRTIRNFTSI